MFARLRNTHLFSSALQIWPQQSCVEIRITDIWVAKKKVHVHKRGSWPWLCEAKEIAKLSKQFHSNPPHLWEASRSTCQEMSCLLNEYLWPVVLCANCTHFNVLLIYWLVLSKQQNSPCFDHCRNIWGPSKFVKLDLPSYFKVKPQI